jgi:hypothetical protein
MILESEMMVVVVMTTTTSIMGVGVMRFAQIVHKNHKYFM